MTDVTIRSKGGAYCRICGLHYAPDSPEDQNTHRTEHQKLVQGALPLEVREFLKALGWAVAHNDGGFDRQKGAWSQEIGKIAVVFAWWTRARANGIGDDQFDDYMAAHLAYVDAMVAHDEDQLAAARARIEPWQRFAG